VNDESPGWNYVVLTLLTQGGTVVCCIHCVVVTQLCSQRNILILTADDLIFQLPVGFSERLHSRLDQEMTS
jgi:hypothetical protein